MSPQLTPHFSDAEMGYPPRELTNAARRLCQQLEVIREAAGAPIRITSGYRDEARNRAVGGAAGSMHLSARAADIQVTRGPYADAARLADLIESLLRIGAVEDGGLGRYSTWVHYDIGPEGRRWGDAT